MRSGWHGWSMRGLQVAEVPDLESGAKNKKPRRTQGSLEADLIDLGLHLAAQNTSQADQPSTE